MQFTYFTCKMFVLTVGSIITHAVLWAHKQDHPFRNLKVSYCLCSSYHLLFLIGGGCPAIRDLSNFVVPDVSIKWFNLGLQLLDHRNKLQLHRLKHWRDSSDASTEIFHHWLTTASLKKMISALRSPTVSFQHLSQSIATDIKVQWVRNKLCK